jgi:hypothetical protein
MIRTTFAKCFFHPLDISRLSLLGGVNEEPAVVRAASSVSVLSKGGECWWGERKEAMTQGIGMDFVHGCLLSVGSMINAFTFHDAVCCVVLCCVVLCCVAAS